MKFECIKCGRCCVWDKSVIIFPEEYKVLTYEAEKRNLKINLKPFVLKGSRILLWQLLECPFLQDNKCLIYEQRPLICVSYPLTEQKNGGICYGYAKLHPGKMEFTKGQEAIFSKCHNRTQEAMREADTVYDLKDGKFKSVFEINGKRVY